MSLDLKLILDEFNRRFDEMETRWDRRFSAYLDLPATPLSVNHSSSDASASATPTPIAVIADNWGGCFDDGEQYCAAPSVVADNWGGFFDGEDAATNTEFADSSVHVGDGFALSHLASIREAASRAPAPVDRLREPCFHRRLLDSDADSLYDGVVLAPSSLCNNERVLALSSGCTAPNSFRAGSITDSGSESEPDRAVASSKLFLVYATADDSDDRLYRHRVPQGSPFTSVGRILAAVPSGLVPAWSICMVTQVEETKPILKLVPLDALSDVVIDAPTKCLREFLSTDVNVQASVFAAEGCQQSPVQHASPGAPTLSLHTSSLKSQVHINVSNHYLFDEMPLCHGVFHLCNMSLFASKSIITAVLGSPRTYIVLLCPATNACDDHNVFGQVNQHDSGLLWPLPKRPWPPPKQLKVMHDEVDLRPALWPSFILVEFPTEWCYCMLNELPWTILACQYCSSLFVGVEFLEHMVMSDVRVVQINPWPPPTLGLMHSDSIQLRPIPWPSFRLCSEVGYCSYNWAVGNFFGVTGLYSQQDEGVVWLIVAPWDGQDLFQFRFSELPIYWQQSHGDGFSASIIRICQFISLLPTVFDHICGASTSSSCYTSLFTDVSRSWMATSLPQFHYVTTATKAPVYDERKSEFSHTFVAWLDSNKMSTQVLLLAHLELANENANIRPIPWPSFINISGGTTAWWVLMFRKIPSQPLDQAVADAQHQCSDLFHASLLAKWLELALLLQNTSCEVRKGCCIKKLAKWIADNCSTLQFLEHCNLEQWSRKKLLCSVQFY